MGEASIGVDAAKNAIIFPNFVAKQSMYLIL